MRDSKSSEKKPLQEVQAPRPRKVKLERLSRDITERKREEEELKRSKEWLANIINALDDPVFVKDEQHRWVVLNDAACEVMGRPREELIGKSDYDLFSKEQADVFWERDNSVLKSGQTDVNEEEITWHGKLHTISTKKSIFTDSLTGKKFIAGTIRDVTERKHAEDAKDRLLKTIETAKEAMSTISSSLIITYTNDAMDELFGYEKGELIGKHVSICNATPAPEAVAKKIADAVEKNGWWEGEVHNKRKNGTRFLSYATISAYKDKGGKTISFLSTQHNITERKKAEDALRESEEKFRILAEQSPNMIFINKKGKVVYANKKCEEITGYKKEEFYSPDFNFINLIAPESRNLVKASYNQHIKGQEVTPYEYALITKKGKRIEVIHATKLITYEGESAILGIETDITERKQVEEALRESEEKYRGIFEQAADSIVLVDGETGALLEFNDRAHETLGYTRDEFRKLKIPDFEVIETAEEVGKHIQKIVKEGADTFETKHRRKDGKIRDALVSSKAISIDGRDFCMSIWRDITERKKAEEEIRKFKTICDRAGYGVAMSDVEGNLIFVNRSFAQMHGYTADELIGKNLSLFHNQEQMKNVDKLNDNLRREGSFIAEEVWHKRKDDTVFPTLMHGTLIRDEKQKPLFMAATAVDITERKRVEETLQKSEQKLRLLFEGTYDLISLTDDNAKTLWANPAWGKIFGQESEYEPDSFSNIHPDDLEKVTKSWQDLISKGTIIKNIEYRYRIPEGRYLHFESSAYPVVIGEEQLYYVVARDITERKNAEKESKKSRDSLIEAQRIAHLGSWEWDIEENKLSWSEEVYHIFGLKHEEFTGDFNGFFSWVHPDDKSLTQKAVEEATSKGKPIDFEHRIILPDGTERIVYEKGETIYDESGKAVRLAGTVYDITERKKADEKLLEYQGQLRSLASELSLAEERERRRIATELHDQISQSLVISKMKVEALRESASGKELNKALDEIANSLGQTIADTRSLTSDIHPPLLALLGFEEAVAALLSEQIEEKHGIAAEFEDDGLPKPMDDDIRILLFRDVRELLTNVVRHAHAHKVKVSVRKVDDKICVSVEDDGVGFDPAEVASIGFETNGFGLFSIQERLEELGGHLEIEFEPGQGAKVTITAPLQDEKNIEGRKI